MNMLLYCENRVISRKDQLTQLQDFELLSDPIRCKEQQSGFTFMQMLKRLHSITSYRTTTESLLCNRLGAMLDIGLTSHCQHSPVPRRSQLPPWRWYSTAQAGFVSLNNNQSSSLPQTLPKALEQQEEKGNSLPQ